jgi:hypothetical protein
MRTERRPLQVYGFTPWVLAAVKLLTPVQALLDAFSDLADPATSSTAGFTRRYAHLGPWMVASGVAGSLAILPGDGHNTTK